MQSNRSPHANVQSAAHTRITRMASIKRHGSGWRVFVSGNGRRATKVLPTLTEARAWAREKETELRLGPRPALGGLHALLDRFAREACPARRGGATDAKRLARLKRELPDAPLERLDAPILAAWRDERLRTVRPASVRRDMGLLRAVFELARTEWRLLPVNPLADVRRPPAPPPRRRLIAQAEVDALVARLRYSDELPVVLKSQEVAVMFLLAIETGMRAGELLTCEVRGRVAHLPQTKNGDAREVPLSSRAVELFGKVPTGFTVSSASRDALFRAARDAAGLSGFTFHDSRALALTRLSRRLDVLTLARVVGHRDPRSLMVYYRESAEDIAARLG